MVVQNLIAKRQRREGDLRSRYKEILLAFNRGEEPEDTDEVLLELGISIDEFARDIDRVKQRLALDGKVQAGKGWGPKLAEIEAAMEKERQAFHDEREAHHKRYRALLDRQGEIGTIIDEGRKALRELHTTADSELLVQEEKLVGEVEVIAQSVDRNEADLKRMKARPRTPTSIGDLYVAGRDPVEESKIESHIGDLRRQKQAVEVKLGDVRRQIVLP